MDINKTNRKAYAYTVKKLIGQDNVEGHYDPFFTYLEKHTDIEFKFPEFDSKGRLHFHGIFHCSKNFYIKRLERSGFHFKVDELYNKAGWEKYIMKDQEFTKMPIGPEELTPMQKPIWSKRIV